MAESDCSTKAKNTDALDCDERRKMLIAFRTKSLQNYQRISIEFERKLKEIKDHYGFISDEDKIKQIIRWKGENVSTSEVEGIVSRVLQMADCVVFGVDVPGMEGKAGMVVLPESPEVQNMDHKKFLEDLRKSLPASAIPLFIRVVEKLESTGTYEFKKVDLQKEGFNPNVVSDVMFYMDPKEGTYKRLDLNAYDDICQGKIRF